MRVLVFCEFSGTVLEAFLAAGHDAYSADLLPTESAHKDRHYQGDGLWLLREPWDLVIAHPPCTYLANSGVQYLYKREGRWQAMVDAAFFFSQCQQANSPRVAVENPTTRDGGWGQIYRPVSLAHQIGFPPFCRASA